MRWVWTPRTTSRLKRVGQSNAKWFDHFGFNYFTREVYDNFYPDYGGMAMT